MAAILNIDVASPSILHYNGRCGRSDTIKSKYEAKDAS